MTRGTLLRAEDVSPEGAAAARAAVTASLARSGERPREALVELGTLLACAYPALAPGILAHPEDLLVCRAASLPRDGRAYRRLAAMACGDPVDGARVKRGLRRFASREKLRIAARELLALPGQDVDVTARELSELAEVCCEVALGEALFWADARFGSPRTAEGAPCGFVVVGAGKLGGHELNAGSDIDLILFYETDEGEVRGPSGGAGHTLHEHFVRVARRMVATLDEPTDDGMAWRVDLRLRPEGGRGPLAMSLAAAERYYETWGRTWERAALLRARPVAGDLAFGDRLMGALSPFVWRREVDPRVVGEVGAMLNQARAEAGSRSSADLKIGPGGIREVEFFAQGLQLVWGGREPGIRVANTLDALRRLRGRGLVSEREEIELSDAYLFLRRLEHRVQFATGLQTHSLPAEPDMLGRIARSLGYDGPASLLPELAAVRGRVHARFGSLGPDAAPAPDPALQRILAALDRQDEPAPADLAPRFGASAAADLPRHLLALAQRPDFPLGAATRDHDPSFAGRLVDALSDAADPEQAARLLAAFFLRLDAPGTYVRALVAERRLLRAMCSLTGASAFLGEALVAHPDLVDQVLYTRTPPTPAWSEAQVAVELDALSAEDAGDVDAFVGALRRARRRATFEVGLADLAGELTTWEVGRVLTSLADATLAHACRFALRERAPEHPVDRPGLAVIAMGKLGGREIGYGSDLDLFFVYQGGDRDPGDLQERFARVAQRVLQLVGTPHGDGPGYELDTRLRPSGNQGLLVASLAGFERYTREQAADWERQALVKARACAGDPVLGAEVSQIAERVAYGRGAPDAVAVDHLRRRMERELGHERLDRSPARYDLKVGRGGIVDVEFATQWLQMRHGADARVRTTETGAAITALETCGYLDAASAATLRDAWSFLRRLEQRLRVAHGASVSLLEEGAPGLLTLARSMGSHDGPRARPDLALLERYVTVTRDVRAAYLRLLGLTDGGADPRDPRG
jgi:[glutamine synthetase] adenylyltransferase / [glutamine synthetase]-adenylyl-L-tyrosine phosphorylase